MLKTEPRFTPREFVRCVDCDLRGDLHAAGFPRREARSSVKACNGCGGAGELPPPSPRDPYDEPPASGDYYAAKRARRADVVRRAMALPEARRAFFSGIRAERRMGA